MIFTKGKDADFGFTIVELMIVVVIIGILATVSIVSYRKYIERARATEATSILADIRLKQEAYRATFHRYASPETWNPDSNPSMERREWDGDDDGWAQLGIRPDSGVFFSYFCEAGLPGGAPSTLDDVADFSDFSNNDFWFIARAYHDIDGDGKCAGMDIYPGNGPIRSWNDHEHGGTCP